MNLGQSEISQANTSRALYSLENASRTLGGISIWTLRKHVAQGTVRVTKLGRRVFVSAEELARIQREGLPSLRNCSRVQQAA
jgi:hypothetical protein